MRLVRKSGLLFTSLYLKQCAVHLQQYYAESDIVVDKSAVKVSLSRAGLPAIIPKHHRFIIMKRGDRGDRLVRLYLSWFSICRVIPLAKRISKATFNSMIQPQMNVDGVKNLLGIIKDSFNHLQKIYLPWISEIPLDKGISWKPTWKSMPNDDRRFLKKPKPVPNVFSSLKYELAAFAHGARLYINEDEAWHPGMLWSKRTLYPLDYSFNTRSAWCDLEFDRQSVEPEIERDLSFLRLHSGRLTCTLVGAGKRRLFAIGNYVRQRLLHPVHKWAMQVLSRIPSDGTFNQERPIHRLSRFCPSDVISLDLSSATDRWPVVVLTALFTRLFGRALALCVVNGTLWWNVFYTHRPLLNKARYIHFATGQPLGYYGSWALFSLSHHYMVWLAAWLVYPRRKEPFRRYALLGDDIVIADRAVAEKYRELIGILDVSISESKSIDCRTGALEFAKQFWVKRVQVNLTPISAKAILSAFTLVGLCQLAEKYNLSRLCLIRLAGAGYRVRGRMLSNNLSRYWKRLRIVADKSLSYYQLPLDLWFGRGNPLNPYLKGIIIDKARTKFMPKQLVIVPSERLWYAGEEDLLEYTLYHNWLKEWLEWLRWYCIVALAPNPSLEDLFDPPMVSHTWKRNTKEHNVLKYGFLWRCWDLGDGWNLGRVPPCLSSGGNS